jgi:MYXO-CTERM domain-containing protein
MNTALALLLPVGVIITSAAGRAEAATPTYYNSLPAFQADITFTVTDDYSNPGYVFIQSDAVMSAVIGETDYQSTGFNNLNIVNGGYYCAGCNGSFELSFQTTSVGAPTGVNGVGVYIQVHSLAVPYYAYITFADGTTANIALPGAGSFWGVAAPERIERIHFGLSMGGTTQNGSFGIDNLIVGDGNIGTCEQAGDCVDDGNPCTDAACNAGMCTYVPNLAPCDDGNPCTDEACSGGTCVAQFNANPCDDDEVCTENDVCSLGTCQGSLVSCDDGNPCTTNYCDFGTGCAVLNNTMPCDDGNPCTAMDACSAGTCSGTMVNCSDANACTADSCDPLLGCVNEPIGGCCTDDADCSADETCDPATNACVPAATGSTGDDDSSGGTPADAGVDDSGGNSGVGDSGASETGSAGSTSSAGSTGDTGLGLDGGGTPSPGGCACSTTPSPERRLAWLLVPLCLLLGRRRRLR